MNAYKVELLIVNHDGIDEEEVKRVLENTHYPNYCIAPYVMDIESHDIGEWTDDHPLNNYDTIEETYNDLFFEALIKVVFDRLKCRYEMDEEQMRQVRYIERDLYRLISVNL